MSNYKRKRMPAHYPLMGQRVTVAAYGGPIVGTVIAADREGPSMGSPWVRLRWVTVEDDRGHGYAVSSAQVSPAPR